MIVFNTRPIVTTKYSRVPQLRWPRSLLPRRNPHRGLHCRPRPNMSMSPLSPLATTRPTYTSSLARLSHSRSTCYWERDVDGCPVLRPPPPPQSSFHQWVARVELVRRGPHHTNSATLNHHVPDPSARNGFARLRVRQCCPPPLHPQSHSLTAPTAQYHHPHTHRTLSHMRSPARSLRLHC